MNYPEQMQMGARSIHVHVTDAPMTRAADNKKVVGKFLPLAGDMYIFHDTDKPEIGGEAFVHELCEAADVIYDLKLPHQTIQTLSAALFQAFSSGKVAFAN